MQIVDRLPIYLRAHFCNNCHSPSLSTMDYKGFFVPPPSNQNQTASISKQMLNAEDVDHWYQTLSRVEPLAKVPVKVLMDQRQYEKEEDIPTACQHRVKAGSIVWVSKKGEVFCDKCGIMLKFSECIRKYVLERYLAILHCNLLTLSLYSFICLAYHRDHPEVVHYTWPWYRNYHRRDGGTEYQYVIVCVS